MNNTVSADSFFGASSPQQPAQSNSVSADSFFGGPTATAPAPTHPPDSFASLAMRTAKGLATSLAPALPVVGSLAPIAQGLVEHPGALPVAGGVVGGILGGAVGAIPGAMGGATVGGALGEHARQVVQGEPLNPIQDAKVGAASGVSQLAGDGLGALVGKILPGISPAIASVAGKMSGYGKSILDTAMQRTPGAIAGATHGEAALNTEIMRTASNLADHAKQVLQQSKDTVAHLDGASGGGRGFPGTRQAILDAGTNFVRSITENLRSNYNVGVTKGGTLDFNRSTMPSNIVSGSDGKTIQDAFNLVRGITKDTSIKNIDSILERMMVLKSKTPNGTPTGPETKAIVNQMMDHVQTFVRSLGDISPAYTHYADFLEHNLPTRVFINDAKDMFGASKHLAAEDVSRIGTRMLQTFNSGKSAIKEFAGKVGTEVGTDPVGTAAGVHINEEQMSMRAANLNARSIAAKVFEALPRGLVKNYVQTGNVFGLESHPLIQKAAHILGISVQAMAQQVSQMAAEATN